MNAHQGPRSRPSGEVPGGSSPLYEGVEVPAVGAGTSPDALADVDDKASRRRGKYRQTGPLWCEPPCVLPYHHHGECWDGVS